MGIFQILHGQYYNWDKVGLGLNTKVISRKTEWIMDKELMLPEMGADSLPENTPNT